MRKTVGQIVHHASREPDPMTMPIPESQPVHHVPASSRFEVRVDGAVAFLSYKRAGEVVVIDHTFVPETLRGRGIAAILTRSALGTARQEGWRIAPLCSYVATFIERHPEYADLVGA